NYSKQSALCIKTRENSGNEHSRLPLRNYRLLCELTGTPTNKVPTILITNTTKTIQHPSLCPDLAEFLGIIAGDGHINSLTYEVSVTLDGKTDRDYATRVYELFKALFGLTPSWIEGQNVIRIKAYSIELSKLLTGFGYPSDRKMGKLRIPPQCAADAELSAAFLRGVFDTDGSIHRHHHSDACVEFISRDWRFLQDIVWCLKQLGFRAGSSGKNAYIYAREDIHHFFRKIKPANPKHQRRYRQLLSTATFK
ncbi:MAG: LAGLIDADG family homing endonuclease, partial [Nanoarchaeota archaeon]